MPGNRYLSLLGGARQWIAAQQSSAGTSSAGSIVALNSAGLVDSSMLPALPTQRDFPNQAVDTGSIASFQLYRCTSSGLHRVAVYAAPVTANSIATVQVVLTWVDGGVTRTWTSAALSLVSLTASILQQMIPLRCDTGTAISAAVQVTGSGGAYTACLGVHPPQ